MDFSLVKLVIWDLDETFWNGTLSENTASIPKDRVQLVHNMIDCGVMCSICSKNDYDVVKKYLSDNDMWDFFVFPSINWSSKGQRVRQIINEMNLRPANVLFIDDNHSNRAEVKEINGKITVADIDIISELKEFFEDREKRDRNHTRLEQYKILEKKKNFRATFGNNKEFLKQCEIKVNIKYDCITQIERIHELVVRTNQLNFTKRRDSIDELIKIIEDSSINTGYVEVEDKFGKYGVVGFFSIRDGKAIHFLFSCRVLGMGVEQYLYRTLKCPNIDICGDVSSTLDTDEMLWINLNKEENKEQKNKSNVDIGKIVFKGPCDMSQLFAFVQCGNNVVTEFVYVNKKGVSIEQGNHSEHIVESIKLSTNEKHMIIDELPFGDEQMYSTSIFDDDVSVVVYSLFTDPNLGVYREKNTGYTVAFGEYMNDLTDSKRWDDYINERVFTANCQFTEESLIKIREKWNYEGRLSAEKIVQNIDFIYEHLSSKATLILVLGSEIPYEKNNKPSYDDRHLFNQKLNSLIREWGENLQRVKFLDVNRYIECQEDFTNNINHFARIVFYRMSKELVEILTDIGVDSAKQNGEIGYIWNEFKRKYTAFCSNPVALIKKRMSRYRKNKMLDKKQSEKQV